MQFGKLPTGSMDGKSLADKEGRPYCFVGGQSERRQVFGERASKASRLFPCNKAMMQPREGRSYPTCGSNKGICADRRACIVWRLRLLNAMKKPRRDGGHKPGLLRVPYGGTCDGEGIPITSLFYRFLIFQQQTHSFSAEAFGRPQCRHSLRFDCLRFEIRAITGETSNGREKLGGKVEFFFLFCA